MRRDGVAIARTTQKQYVDHTSIGSATYRVRGCYADSDNYGVSNSATAEILPETNMICDLETGVWLEMRLSETQLRANRASFSAGVSTVHLAGLAYPVEELKRTARPRHFRRLRVSAQPAGRRPRAGGPCGPPRLPLRDHYGKYGHRYASVAGEQHRRVYAPLRLYRLAHQPGGGDHP
ncbi:MAG: hypothetical protein ACLU3I_05635 [Acutalibacteraceae bacterium]